MDNKQNLESYSDVENLNRFNEASFAEYCNMKLRTAEPNVNFIKNHVFPGQALDNLNICEIGSGNSKLLYALERQMSNGGKLVGYEVSKSRWLFAEKFKEWIGSQRVTNHNEDVLSSRTDEMFDLIICADIVTQIISPLFDTAEQEYFGWIRQHLSDGGRVFLEFEDFSQTIAELGQQGVLSECEEFPCEDPFQYGLYREYLDSDGNLVWDKRFFERSTREFSCFSNVIKNYTPEQACKALSAAGFDLEIYNSPEIRAEFEITDLERHNNMFYVIAWKHD